MGYLLPSNLLNTVGHTQRINSELFDYMYPALRVSIGRHLLECPELGVSDDGAG